MLEPSLATNTERYDHDALVDANRYDHDIPVTTNPPTLRIQASAAAVDETYITMSTLDIGLQTLLLPAAVSDKGCIETYEPGTLVDT